jgi:hypothetical protein
MFFELSPERTSAEKFYISHNKHLKGYLQNRKENRKVKIFTLPSMGRVIQKTCLKDEVHCKIDDRILKNFYHHWILHLKEPGVAKISGLCCYSENSENFQLQRGDQALSQISKIFKMLIKA